jgi:Spy/CpxP family protein refolding chaperone
MQKRVLLMALAALLVLGVASTSMAGAFRARALPGLHLPKMAPGVARDAVEPPMRHPMIEDLGLSDEQIAQIKQVQDAHFEQAKALRIELMDKNNEMRQLLWQRTPDQSAVEALRAQIRSIHEKLVAQSDEMRSKVNDILTEDQLAKIRARRDFGGCGPRSRIRVK